jgi:hypothetical protein
MQIQSQKDPYLPLLRTHPDSGHHAVAWCPAVMGMVQEKHNKVVRCITKAIAQGDKGAHHIAYTDGGRYQKWADGQAAALHRPMNHLPRISSLQQNSDNAKVNQTS